MSGFGHSAIDDYAAFLTAYWKMEATGANNRLDSIGSNDAVPTGAPGTRAGIKNNACDFPDDNTHKLVVPYAADVAPSTGYAISIWDYPDVTAQNGGLCSVGLEGANACFGGMVFAGSGDKLIHYHYQSDSGDKRQPLNPWPTLGSWHNIILMACNGFVRTYIDGTEPLSPVAYDNTVKDTGQDFVIGNTAATTLEHDGGLDEVGFWKNISFPGTTEREAFVSAIWNGGTGRFWEFLADSYLTRQTTSGVLDRTAAGVLVRVLAP